MLSIKKSQISIFIIISVILIIVSAFLFFNSSSPFFISKSNKVKSQVIDVVNGCLQKNAETGAFLLGFQGGRINLPASAQADPLNFQKRYLNLGGFKILSWDSQLGDVPSIASMQTELANYIRNNSFTCIKVNMLALNQSLNYSIEDNLSVNVKLNDNNIAVTANLPIRFNEINSKQQYTTSDYFVSLDGIKLKSEFELATKIYNLEAKSNFFEKLIMEQIYSDNDYNSPQSMPSEGMNINCGFVPWTIPQLKSNLANLNNENFKYLQFQGTYSKTSLINANLNNQYGTLNFKKYYESPTIGYVQQINDSNPNFKDFDVDVSFPQIQNSSPSLGYFQEYPYREFKVTPSDGQIVKPMNLQVGAGSSGFKVPVPCIQVYHELYSLDYDLMVKIVDKSSDGSNYFFQFPIRVVIKNNQPKVNTNSLINDLGITPLTATNDKFNSNESKKYPLYVYAIDKNTGNALDGVNISYKCMYLDANIGQTSKLSYNNYTYGHNAYLYAKFPFCDGGEIVAKKAGYFNGVKKGVVTDSSLLESNSTGNIYQVNMIPELNFPVDVSSFLIAYKETKTSAYLRNSSDGSIYVDISNKALNFDSQIIYPTPMKGYYDKLTLLDDPNVEYNVSVYYSGPNYNLKGMFQLTNWKPNLNLIRSGAKVNFIIPSTTGKIDQNNYQSFANYSKLAVSSGQYGIKFN